MGRASIDRAENGLPFTPVIIIGAGRSGTNALRDALTALPGFATWNCDEINPIWRHGNLRHPDDALPPELARPEVRAYVRGAFLKLWVRSGRPDFVVEKTCANSLRVPFVDRILPEARYVFLRRDGIDVVASARKRWRGEMEVPGLPYYLAKARHTPPSDLPAYAWSFLRARAAMALGRRRHLGVWGPRFKGMETLKDASLEELCARQWAACVSAADQALGAIGPQRVLRLRYEDFVGEPWDALRHVADFLQADVSAAQIAAAAATVRPGSVGKGRAALPDLDKDIAAILAQPMKQHGSGG